MYIFPALLMTIQACFPSKLFLPVECKQVVGNSAQVSVFFQVLYVLYSSFTRRLAIRLLARHREIKKGEENKVSRQQHLKVQMKALIRVLTVRTLTPEP